MAYLKIHFESQYLNGNTEVGIILPDRPKNVDSKNFYKSGRRYKVLWLLHGTFGDYSDWIRKSQIEIYAREKNLIVVMPSGLNANYSNWSSGMMGYSMYDYITEELMPLVYSWFPASDKREDNYICGLSMGGGGALKYAVNHPKLFSAAAILSSAPKNIIKTAKNPEFRDANSIANAGGYEEYVNSEENIWKILGEMKEFSVLPRLLFICGTKDPIAYERFLIFREYSKSIKLDATFEEAEGMGHEWRLWSSAMERIFEFFGV